MNEERRKFLRGISERLEFVRVPAPEARIVTTLPGLPSLTIVCAVVAPDEETQRRVDALLDLWAKKRLSRVDVPLEDRDHIESLASGEMGLCLGFTGHLVLTGRLEKARALEMVETIAEEDLGEDGMLDAVAVWPIRSAHDVQETFHLPPVSVYRLDEEKLTLLRAEWDQAGLLLEPEVEPTPVLELRMRVPHVLVSVATHLWGLADPRRPEDGEAFQGFLLMAQGLESFIAERLARRLLQNFVSLASVEGVHLALVEGTSPEEAAGFMLLGFKAGGTSFMHKIVPSREEERAPLATFPLSSEALRLFQLSPSSASELDAALLDSARWLHAARHALEPRDAFLRAMIAMEVLFSPKEGTTQAIVRRFAAASWLAGAGSLSHHEKRAAELYAARSELVHRGKFPPAAGGVTVADDARDACATALRWLLAQREKMGWTTLSDLRESLDLVVLAEARGLGGRQAMEMLQGRARPRA